MAITHVQLFSIPVSDQDASIAFYCHTLGLELLADEMMAPDQRWVQVRPRASVTSLALVMWFPTMPPGSMKGVVLETDDLDGDIERLTSQGVEVPPVEAAPWGRFTTFDDPDGNGIVLQATAPTSA